MERQPKIDRNFFFLLREMKYIKMTSDLSQQALKTVSGFTFRQKL